MEKKKEIKKNRIEQYLIHTFAMKVELVLTHIYNNTCVTLSIRCQVQGEPVCVYR